MDLIHTITSYSRRYILILFPRLCLGLPSCLFLSGFPTKILYAFLGFPVRAVMPHLSQPPWFDHNKIWWRVQTEDIVIVQLSSASSYFISLRSESSSIPFHFFEFFLIFHSFLFIILIIVLIHVILSVLYMFITFIRLTHHSVPCDRITDVSFLPSHLFFFYHPNCGSR
jgi:hypothetical protein